MKIEILKKEGKNKLILFLENMNNEFPIPLTQRVDIEEYVNKVIENGYVVVCLEEQKIIGAILFYANNKEEKQAYISLLGIDSNYRRNHIATHLLDEALKIIKDAKMQKVKVYTHKTNEGAKTLYRKNAFEEVESDREHSVCYEKKINRGGVLVTAIGSFSADIVIKELRRLGYEIVGCDIYEKNWIVDSQNVDYFEKAPLAIHKEEYIQFIHELCYRYSIDYIIPLTDVEVDVLSDEKKILEDKGIQLCISDRNIVKLCRNKSELPTKLQTICPQYLIPTTLLTDIQEKQLEFPIMIKPIDGRSSLGICKIYNDEEYVFYRKVCKKPENMIVQPIIEGNVVTVDVVSDLKNHIAVAIPRRELLRTGNGAGTTVELFYHQELVELCKYIALELKINGAVNMEFIEDNSKKYHFLEINPRFSGGVEFSHIMGYPIIENHMKCFNGEIIQKDCPYQDMIIARKYEEYIMKEGK